MELVTIILVFLSPINFILIFWVGMLSHCPFMIIMFQMKLGLLNPETQFDKNYLREKFSRMHLIGETNGIL